jgi:hypothetical protein
MIFYFFLLFCCVVQICGSEFSVDKFDLETLKSQLAGQPTLLDYAPIDFSFDKKHSKDAYLTLVSSLDYLPELFKENDAINILEQAKRLSFCTPPDPTKPNYLPIISRISEQTEKIFSIGDVHGSAPSMVGFIDFY